MRILILDDAGQTPAALQSMFPDVFDESTTSDTGILASLTLPGIVSSRLFRSGAQDVGCESQREAATQNPLAPFHMEDCPELTPTALDTFGLACLASGRLTEAEHFITAALELRLKFFGEGHPEVALSRNSLARVFRDASKLDAAVAQIMAAKDIDVRVFGNNSLAVAADLAVLGSIQFQQAKLMSARESAVDAIKIFDDKLNGNDPWVPYLLDIMARVHLSLGEYSQAEALYNKLLPMDIQRYGASHPVVATRKHNLGTVLEARGDLKTAEAMYCDAITALEEHGCNLHPQMIDALANRGAVRRAQKDFPGARQDLNDALRLNEKLRGEGHAFTGYDHLNLGFLEIDSGSPEQALTSLGKALTIFRQTLPEYHAYIATTLTLQGRALVNLQKAAAAEKPLEEALKLWPVEYGNRSVEYAVAHATLAKAWFDQNKRLGEVEQILRDSVAIISAIKPASDNTLQLINSWLSDVTARAQKTNR